MKVLIAWLLQVSDFIHPCPKVLITQIHNKCIFILDADQTLRTKSCFDILCNNITDLLHLKSENGFLLLRSSLWIKVGIPCRMLMYITVLYNGWIHTVLFAGFFNSFILGGRFYLNPFLTCDMHACMCVRWGAWNRHGTINSRCQL